VTTIDAHTHVVPDLPPGPAWWPRLAERDDGRTDVVIGERVFRTVRRIAHDLDRRARELAPGSQQVLSPMPELFSYAAPAKEAAKFCDATNDWIAEGVRRHPGVFHGFGMVPLQDPDLAAAQLPGIAVSGLRGIEIGSNVEGVPLYDTRYEEFFTEAERLDLVVFVHAFHPPAIGTFTDAMAGNAVTFPNEIGQAIGGLIAEGVLERHPKLKLFASHGGGSLASLLPRLRFIASNFAGARTKMPRDPAEYAQRIFYDMLVFSAPLLELLVSTVGRGQIVVGSDKPFMDVDPATLLHYLPALEASAVDAIRFGNAQRLLGLVNV
jgi:aminocarboxymuconate-semialdehyde decarboxylase